MLWLQAVVSASPRWHELSAAYTFDAYAHDFAKEYATADERHRRSELFHDRLADITRHNADPAFTWKRGVNHLTDRFPHELRSLHGLDRSLLHSDRVADPAKSASASPTWDPTKNPAEIDWRKKGVLTPVKNQGACGSCWTFASVETLESRWAQKTGELQELSEQFVLDCVANPQQCGGTGGCMGGTAKLVYDGLGSLGGIPSEWTYPYLSGSGAKGTCHGTPLAPSMEKPHGGLVAKAANITGHVSLPTNDYDAIMSAIAEGPLAVSVDAAAWHDYEEGVFAGGNATNPTLDHLVQLVGYGTTGDEEYFIIRNSWTPLWGESGFMRLKRSAGAACGVDLRPMDGDGCKGGPKAVKVCGQNGILYDAVYPLV